MKYVDFANLHVYKNISSVADVKAWDFHFYTLYSLVISLSHFFHSELENVKIEPQTCHAM